MDLVDIDISPLMKEEHEGDVTQVIDQFRHVLENVGFFYVSGHGIPENLIAKLFEMQRKFFALPPETKDALDLRKRTAYRGYVTPGSDVTSDRADVKEGIYFGHNSHDIGAMKGTNVYPNEDQLPGLEEVVTQYMAKLDAVGDVLLKAIALSIGKPASFFDDMFSEPFPLFALWHYPTQLDESELTWGIGPHTDYGVMTLLLQDDVGGLQVKRKNGAWIDLPPKQGSLTVLVGDVVEIWTRGRYQATWHRVKNSANKSRYSAPFFYQPRASCAITPLDVSVHPPGQDYTPKHSTPFLFGDYVHEKFRKSYSGRL